MSNLHLTADLHIEYSKLAVIAHTLNFVHDHVGPKETPEHISDLLWGCSNLMREIVPRLLELKNDFEDADVARQQPA